MVWRVRMKLPYTSLDLQSVSAWPLLNLMLLIRHRKCTMILCMLKTQKCERRPTRLHCRHTTPFPNQSLRHSHNVQSTFRMGHKMVPRTTTGDQSPNVSLSTVLAAEDVAGDQGVA